LWIRASETGSRSQPRLRAGFSSKRYRKGTCLVQVDP
jgi:hypothetical protein